MRNFLRFFSRREDEVPEQCIYTDEHGYQWVDKEFFGFGDFSRAKDNLLELNYPSAEEYLRSHGDEYPWRDLWLRHGRTFRSPSRWECLIMRWTGGHVSGNCYNNVLRLALGEDDDNVWLRRPKKIMYCEGLAVNPTGAYLHAWLILDGNVYDLTWPDAHRATYFGVTFDPQWMLDFAETVGRVSLLQNWTQAQPRLVALFEDRHEPA